MNLIKNRSLKQLLWLGIGSMVMFFAGLTSAYVVAKPQEHWVEFVLPNWFFLSTVTIVISSMFLIFAQVRLKKEKPAAFFVFLTFLLGVVFSFFQFQGWQSLTEQGVFLTGPGSNISGSFLYVITLAHLVHLIGGLVAMLVTAINTKKGKYSSQNHLGFELTTIYWHFLGLLWLDLFLFLKYF